MATRTFTPLTARRAAPAPAAPVRRAPVAKAATPGVAAGLPRFAAPRPMAVAASTTFTSAAKKESAVPAVEARTNHGFKAPPTSARRKISARPDPSTRTFERVGRPDSPWENEAGKLFAHVRARTSERRAIGDAPVVGLRPTLAHPGLGPSPPALGDAGNLPLPHAIRAPLEAKIGFDLGGVRIVTGPAAECAAAELHARAFTQHGRIHLGASASPDDRALITHETTHVLQQTLPAAHLARLGLSPAPAEMILRQPLGFTPFADRRKARAELNDPFALPFWKLPRSLKRALNWIGDDGLALRLTRAVPEALNPTLNPLRRLEAAWQAALREIRNFPARKQLWDGVLALASHTDDPALIAAARKVADALPEFLGSRWTDLQRLIDRTADVGDASAQRWNGGLASLAPQIADIAESLGPDITTAFDEFAEESWVTDALRTALGCPGDLKDSASVARWAGAIREQADQMIRGMAGPAANLKSALFDTQLFARLAGQNASARALSTDLRSVAQLMAQPEGLIVERTKLTAILPRVREKIATIDFALNTPMGAMGYAFNGLGFTLQSWGHAPAFVFFPNEFDWMNDAGVEFETWVGEREPQVLAVAQQSLGGLDQWSSLVAETAIEAEALDEPAPGIDRGWTRPIKQFYAALTGAKEKFIAKLMEKVPLLKELKENAAELWQKAATHFARFKERIFKEGRILAPLWEFFLNMLGLVLPIDFIRDVADRAGSLLGKILRHPFRFLGNLAKGIAHGLHRFGQNIGNHLLNSLLEWLLGEFDLQPPVTFGKIVQALMEQTGFSRKVLTERIAEYLKGKGRQVTAAQVDAKLERAIKIGATALRWLKLLFEGRFAEFWQEIKHHLVKLWQWVVDKAVSYVMDQLKKKLLTWLAGFLDPTGIMAIIKTIKAIYDAIRTVIDYAERMLAMVREVFNAVREIADGQIDRAATWVENAAAKGLTVAVAFFARLVGLDSIVDFFKARLKDVKDMVIAAMDALIRFTGEVWEWLVAKAEQAKEWWKNRRTFTDPGGQSHTLLYKVTEQEALLRISEPETGGQMGVQKTPLTLQEYLFEFKPTTDRERGIHGEIANLAARIDNVKKDSGGSFGAADGELIHVLFNEIILLLNELGGKNITPPATVVEWTTKTIFGDAHGKRMVADPLSTDPGGNAGSKPVGTDTTLWSRVKGKQRGGDTAYIKGHLLNHHLHGPGIWKNMVPIARTTNSDMERGPEDKVKQAVLSKNKVVRYEVNMVFGAHRRTPQSNAEAELPSKIEMQSEELKYSRGKWVPSGVAVLRKTTFENDLL